MTAHSVTARQAQRGPRSTVKGPRAIAVAELLVRLRWQERQRRADRSCLTELARALPRGCRLDELRADGSELHLVSAYAADPAERPST